MASVGYVPESLRLLMTLLDSNQEQFAEGQYIQISNLLKSINDTISNNQINLQSVRLPNSRQIQGPVSIKIINKETSQEIIIPPTNEKSWIDSRFRLYMRTKGKIRCEDERIVLRSILQKVTIDRIGDSRYVINHILPEEQLMNLFKEQKNERCSCDTIYIKIKEDYVESFPEEFSELGYHDVKLMFGDISFD